MSKTNTKTKTNTKANARNTFAEDEMLEREFNKEQLKKLLGYVAKYKKQMSIALAVIMLSSFANLMTPLLMKFIIDDFIPDANVKMMVICAIFFVGVIIMSSICMKFRIRFMSKIGQSIIKDIRHDIFSHIQTLPFSFYDSRPHGKILVRVVNYVNSLNNLLSNGFINLVVDGFSFIIAVVIILTLDVRLGLITLAFVPVAIYGVFYIKVRQRKAMQEVSAKQSNMNAYIHESISGMKVTQSFTREDVNLGVFNELMDDYKDRWMSFVHYVGMIFLLSKTYPYYPRWLCLLWLWSFF